MKKLIKKIITKKIEIYNNNRKIIRKDKIEKEVIKLGFKPGEDIFKNF